MKDAKCSRGASESVHRGVRQCEVVVQKAQERGSVAGYTEDFLNQAKLCKPKSAEMWFTNGLRGDIQAKLVGVLEPLEFSLVRRMAGFAIEAEEKIAAKLAEFAGSVGEDLEEEPRMNDGDWEPSVGEPPKRKRGRPWKSSMVPCGCDVLV